MEAQNTKKKKKKVSPAYQTFTLSLFIQSKKKKRRPVIWNGPSLGTAELHIF